MFVACPHPSPLPRGEGAVRRAVGLWRALGDAVGGLGSGAIVMHRTQLLQMAPNCSLSLWERAGVRVLLAFTAERT